VRVGSGSKVQSASEADEARLAEFESRILPLVRARQDPALEIGGAIELPSTIIYIASYFDYVRLRNLLDRNEIEFVAVSEYSEDRDVAQARSAFRRGDVPILLLTERAHFFRRVRIQGACNAIFLGVPRVANFYPEVLNWLGGASDSASPLSALVLFTKFDALQLERVVGSERAARLLTGEKSTFVLV
jgi:U3 small nucleolar RNA-associated protein 25